MKYARFALPLLLFAVSSVGVAYADDLPLSTPSDVIDYDRINQNIDSILQDKLSGVSPAVPDIPDIEPEIQTGFDDAPAVSDLPLNIYSADENIVSDDVGTYAATDSVFHKNVVVYYGVFNNKNCELVVPYAAYSQLDIINGVIVNLGNSAVTGRILYSGAVISPSEYDTYSYIINPVYGSTSSVYSYGSFNYQRHYYLNRTSTYDRISYDDTYGNFRVTDVDVYYSASERVYYALMIIIFMLGGVIIVCRRLKR